MTNERAIELLHRLQDEQFDGIHGDERREALEMAVRALEPNLGQKTIDCIIKRLNDEDRTTDDCISRKMAIDAVSKWLYDVFGIKESDGTATIFKKLRELPSAQPERLTDDDFEAIRIHLNAYKEKLCNQQRWEEAEEYQRIIDRFMAFASAQPQACDDAISRDDAIMAVKTGALSAATIFGRTDEGATAYYETVKAIKALPSAQPQRKKGKWIFHETENDRYDDMICPFCKTTYTVDAYRIDDIGFTAEDFNYCPSCEADMKGESE